MASSVTLVLHKQKASYHSEGIAPIYIRVIKNRRTSYVSTRIKIPAKQWNEAAQKVKSSHPNSVRINNLLQSELAKAYDKVLDAETSNKNIHIDTLKDKIIDKQVRISFSQYVQQHLDSLEQDKKYGTLDKANSVISKFKKYVKNREIMFDEITVTFIKNYETYLNVKIGNSVNTIHSNLKLIRKLMNDAEREDLIRLEDNPFRRYKLKTEKTEKSYLTEDELMKVEELDLSYNSTLDLHRDMYVFSCYAGGLSISDVVKLQWKQFDGQKVYIVIQKTKGQISIQLPNKAIEIINKYRTLYTSQEHYIFPVEKKQRNVIDPKAMFKIISSTTARVSHSLTQIAKLANITKRMNFHSSRHTWATRALTKGMRIEHVSKLMGHSDIKTTQIYAKIIDKDLDAAMEVFN